MLPHIAKHEGCKLTVYRDTRGFRTVGYGFNLDAGDAKTICLKLNISFTLLILGSLALTQQQADDILSMQIAPCIDTAAAIFPMFELYPDNVKIVIVDLIFNLGHAGFDNFKHFIDAIRHQDWKGAAAHLADSLWAKQVKTRADDNIALLESA